MGRTWWALVVALPLAVPGCGGGYTPADVANPDRITVTDAFNSVEEGIKSFSDKLGRDHLFLGMIPCKISVTFNISARAGKDNKATLSFDASAFKVPLKADGSTETSSDATRGNQVTVEYDGITCLPKDTLGAVKPDNIANVARQLEAAKRLRDRGPLEDGPRSDIDRGPLLNGTVDPETFAEFQRYLREHPARSTFPARR